MKKKRHSPEQIIRKFREAEGLHSAGKLIAEICRKLEVSDSNDLIHDAPFASS